MRPINREPASFVSLALAAAGELTLRQVAGAIGASRGAARRAVERLLADGVAVRNGDRRPTYRLAANEPVGQVIGLAAAQVPLARAVVIGARANPAIELVARETGTLTVVFSARSTAGEQSRAARFLEALAAQNTQEVRYRDHDDIRRDLLAEPELRERMARAEILHGELDRTFPDRGQHGTAIGEPLHRAHPLLHLPSRRAIEALARRHGVEALRLFGSGVRSDFRSDSDVDVVVRYRAGVRPSLHSLIELEHALEAAFGRDVDLIREETLRSDVRERIEREAVALT